MPLGIGAAGESGQAATDHRDRAIRARRLTILRAAIRHRCVARVEHPGITGTSYWRTRDFGDVRVRMLEYTPGYVADHWCEKGYILLCLEGELHTELKDGRTFTLKLGMSYQVADNADRSSAPAGATLFVVD